MPSLAIVCDPRDAVAAELAAALAQRAPADFEVAVVAVDDGIAHGAGGDAAVLLAAGPDAPQIARRLRDDGYAGAVVAVWPHRWPRQLDRFHALYRDADAVIVNDAVCWDRLGRLPRTHLVADAVDLEFFAGCAPAAERPARVLLGRAPERRQGDGPGGWLDEEALWLLRDLGVPVVAPGDVTQAADLRAWLRTGSVAVCWDDDATSRRVLLAAAASGCAVVCTGAANLDGLIEDGVSGYLAGTAPAALRQSVEKALRHPAQLAGALRERAAAWSWTRRAPEYFAVLRDILGRLPGTAATPAAPAVDLRGAVTVFVTTVGAPSYAACRDHLAAQDCSFALQVIDHVAPMSAAFQRMLDTCATPFYVQVDEDMLLYPHAVRTLYEQARAAPPTLAVVVGWLLDAHLDVPVQGVKIFRHAVAARYPFADAGSFEIAQLARMRPDGYTHAVVPHAADWSGSAVAAGLLGLHGTHWTPLSIFERYATYERARHALPTHHRAVRTWAGLFLERVMTTGSELDLYALMGVISARLAARLAAGDADAAKDYRRYEGLEGFAAVRAFLAELRRDAR